MEHLFVPKKFCVSIDGINTTIHQSTSDEISAEIESTARENNEQLNPGEDTSSSSSVQNGDGVVRNEVGKEVHSLEEVLFTETLDV